MHNLYHGETPLPSYYGGWWESAKSFAYSIPGVGLASRVFSRESLPCMIAYGNKLRRMEAAAATGDRDAKRLYAEIRKRESRVRYLREGGPIGKDYKDLCRFLESAFVEWEAKTKKREEQEFERMLDTYDPTSGGAAPIAPSMPGTDLAVQQTSGATAGGISTTTLLMAGAGALLLVALLKKKGGEKAAGSRFEGF